MNTKNHSGQQRRKLARLGKYAFLGLICSLPAQKGFSQAMSMSDFFNSSGAYFNVKNYTPVIAPLVNPNTNGHDVVLAGTAFNSSNSPRVNFWRSDHYGTAANVIYHPAIYGPDPNEILVDIKTRAESAANAYYLTCLNSDGTVIGTGTDDGHWLFYANKNLKIRKVDENGTVLNEVNVVDQWGPDNYDTHGLYPMNSLLDDENNILYVCGYWLEGPLSSHAPENKQAFVLAFNIDPDPNANPGGITLIKGLKYDFVPILPVIGRTYDFDMALRMKKLSNGNIAVTGSANAQTGTTSSTINSGSMYITVYPATTITPTPTQLTVATNGSFTKTSGPDGGIIHEYGIDVYEDETNNFATGVTWIASNKFTFNVQTSDLTPSPTGVNLTPSNISSSAVFSPRLSSNNMGWALQIIPKDASGANTGDFAIAGLTNTNSLCNPMVPPSEAPSNSKVTPFIAQVTCNPLPLPNRTVTSSSYDVYTTTTGTDGTSIGAANYMTLGGYDAHPAFHPIVSARYAGIGLQFLTAPRVMPGSFSLGLKTFFVNDQSAGPAAYNLPLTQCGHYNCNIPTFAQEPIRNLGTNLRTSSLTPNVVEQLSIVETIYKNDDYSFCYGAYKPNSVKNIEATYKTQVYPNPATTEVSVVLPKNKNNTSDVKVLLVNVQGQVVATLFNGKADGLKSALQLPDVATGLYIIQVHADGHMIYQQKLSVQK
ncbi:MAG: T9SS type A sorting domain-containing protein [Sphingobacteriales bacterium]|nr:MAG: T9SS type A sorting domain-containing protein [Sphingobacteriales bacterium]